MPSPACPLIDLGGPSSPPCPCAAPRRATGWGAFLTWRSGVPSLLGLSWTRGGEGCPPWGSAPLPGEVMADVSSFQAASAPALPPSPEACCGPHGPSSPISLTPVPGNGQTRKPTSALLSFTGPAGPCCALGLVRGQTKGPDALVCLSGHKCPSYLQPLSRPVTGLCFYESSSLLVGKQDFSPGAWWWGWQRALPCKGVGPVPALAQQLLGPCGDPASPAQKWEQSQGR